LQGLSQLVQLYTGAQINFGDFTPYLTYAQLLMPIPFNFENKNNSEVRSVEQEYVEANFRIGIGTIPRKRKQLRAKHGS
jgi:hypothetical protein